MKHPAPTRADHEAFCRIEGWTPVRDAAGRRGTHHVVYELALSDGRILRTRISHAPNRTTYGPGLWAHILRDQLEVDQGTFWATVRGAAIPARDARVSPPDTLPAEIVIMLVNRVGLARDQIAGMTKEEAIERLNRYWREQR